MPIQRTVIGSFPTPPISVPHEEAVRKAIYLQLKYGIDVVSDGEPYGNMMEYLSPFHGIELANVGIRFTDRIGPMDNPDEYWKFQDYETVKSILASEGREDVKVKITLTGPISLGYFGYFGAEGSLGPYKNIEDPRLYEDYLKAFLPIAMSAIKRKAYLQLDEPYLTKISPKRVTGFLNPFFSSLPRSAIDEEKVSIHVCGQISNSHYQELMKLGARVISLAVSGYQERENLKVISRESLEGIVSKERKEDSEKKNRWKKLNLGFISNTEIEDVKTAFNRLQNASKIVGPENISFVSPECGFLATRPERIEPILANMKEASDLFIKSLQGQ
jgi:methionine synthase II (cobalamin-independent)